MAKGHIAPSAIVPCISWVGCESRKFNRVKQMSDTPKPRASYKAGAKFETSIYYPLLTCMALEAEYQSAFLPKRPSASRRLFLSEMQTHNGFIPEIIVVNNQ